MIDIDLNDLPSEDELPSGPDGETLEYDGIRPPKVRDDSYYLKGCIKTDGSVYRWDVGRVERPHTLPMVILKPREPATEEFRVPAENKQFLVIRGPVRDIELGELYHEIRFEGPDLKNPAWARLRCWASGRKKAEYRNRVRIPASEARLDVEEADEDE